MGKLVPALCIALASATAFAQEKDVASSQSRHAIRLFEEACFKNSGNAQRVRNWAHTAVLLDLSPEQAKPYLGGKPGRAWSAANALGEYVVSVSDAAVCTVYARKANPAALKEMYLAFLPKPETKMTVEKKIDETRKMEHGDLNILGHDISRAGAPLRISMSLSTADSAQAPMQAVISLTVSPR